MVGTGYAAVVVSGQRVSDAKQARFDVFISHASEDKESFVRQLAHALEARHLRVWYDEFTLRPGDSLRRSIDHGLLTSHAGIVIFSPSFFAKRWTAYELDGLVQLHAGTSDQVAGVGPGSRIIPIWHGVDANEVAQASPSLANLVAVRSVDGVDAVADQILKVMRPIGSTLLYAHAELTELGEPHGWSPPVVTADWWLDAAEASATNDVEGTFQEAMGWGRWGFPLPEHSKDPKARGHRLARAAAQMMWQQAAAELPICQVTPPEDVLDFIDAWPGLGDACIEHPSYLLSYAPQLAIPSAAGWLQDIIDETYAWARDRAAHGGVDPDTPEGRKRLVGSFGYLVLRDVELVRAKAAEAACSWVQGEIHGPSVKYYQCIDYAAWLTSERANWMGNDLRAALLDGIAEWRIWPMWNDGDQKIVGQLMKCLDRRSGDPGRREKNIRVLLVERLELACEKLDLREDPDVLADRLLAAGFLDKYRPRGRKPREI